MKQMTENNNNIHSMKDQVSAEEWALRVDLAACYRIVAHYGWDDLIFTHISVRLPGPEHHFLINPFGLMFEEITASSLVKIDLNGEIIGDSPYAVNPAGFIIHSAIHEAREDAHCVLHLHTMEGVAVSCQAQGLLPLSQQSLFPLISLSYHEYEGLAVNPEEKVRLQADLGQTNSMILKNHGLLTLGQDIASAFLSMFILQRSCEIQIMAQSGGAEVMSIDAKILAGIKAQSEIVMQNSGASIVWNGLLRKMDRLDPGFRD